MKQVAFWVFVVGVIIAACYAAKLAPVTPGEGSGAEGAVTAGDRLGAWWDGAALPFSIGVLLMVGGGLLGRRIETLENAPKDASVKALNRPAGSAEGIIDEIAETLAGLPEGELGLKSVEARAGLDRVLEELVPRFLNHRARLIGAMGLEHFAEMIGHFASMERNTARAWSALTDGVPDEAEVCLTQAKTALENAKTALSA
jgi:hypothetical protein